MGGLYSGDTLIHDALSRKYGAARPMFPQTGGHVAVWLG